MHPHKQEIIDAARAVADALQGNLRAHDVLHAAELLNDLADQVERDDKQLQVYFDADMRAIEEGQKQVGMILRDVLKW